LALVELAGRDHPQVRPDALSLVVFHLLVVMPMLMAVVVVAPALILMQVFTLEVAVGELRGVELMQLLRHL
jgi:hypothetical protein